MYKFICLCFQMYIKYSALKLTRVSFVYIKAATFQFHVRVSVLPEKYKHQQKQIIVAAENHKKKRT